MSATAAAPDLPAIPAAAMSRAASRVVIGAAILTLLLSLLDTNIATAAAPTIARDFGGNAISRVPWLVISYALAETIAQPLYGKLADRHGPRPVLLAAIALFVCGSLLCALATSMTELIALRVVQGLGAAGLLSVTFVLIGHIRAGSEDPGAGGNVAAGVMLAVGLVLGPLAGGSIVGHLSWRWIFWVNVPPAVGVFVVMLMCLRLDTERSERRIDWLAAALLTAAAGALQLICMTGGDRYAWWSWQLLLLVALGIAAAVGFVSRQRRSEHPYFPPELLRSTTLRRLTLLQLATGVGMAASIVYVALDLQLVRHYSAFAAGVQTLPMAAGVLAGAGAGAALLKLGRPLRASFVLANMLCGAAFVLLAVTTGAAAALWLLWSALFALGFGVGLSLGNELLVVQSTVALKDLGMATAGVRFVETLGISVGAAGFAVLFAQIGGERAGSPALAAALTVIFSLGAATMLAAAWIAHRLPAQLATVPRSTGGEEC